MKTMQAGAVVLLGLVLAAPAWGAGYVRFNVDPNDPLRCEVSFLTTHTNVTDIRLTVDRPYLPGEPGPSESDFRILLGPNSYFYEPEWQTVSCGRLAWNTMHRATMTVLYWSPGVHRDKMYRDVYTPQEPEPPPEPEPEPPSPPPEPETPTPPEPEPDPEEPDHTHPVERCDHLAIVPAMPRALSGDEGTPDHWLRITNPGAEGITFTVTGRNDAGAEFGTYRRELPAYRSVKVLMRDIEAAFDVSEPEGWWTLTVTGSETQYTSATMKQGDARRFVPVKVPATCPSGAVTATR